MLGTTGNFWRRGSYGGHFVLGCYVTWGLKLGERKLVITSLEVRKAQCERATGAGEIRRAFLIAIGA